MSTPTRFGRAPAFRVTKALGFDPDAVTGDAPDPVDRAITAVFEVPLELSAAAIVQSKASGNTNIDASITTTLDAAPAEGNLLYAAFLIRDAGAPAAPSGWTQLGAVTAGGHGLGVYVKRAGAGESASQTFSPGGSRYKRLFLAEVAGVGDVDGTPATLAEQSSASSLSIGPLTPSAASEILMLATFLQNSSTTFTPGTDWTELDDDNVPGGIGDAFQPTHEVEYRIVSGPSGSYSASTTAGTSQAWGAVFAIFPGATDNTWVGAPELNDGDDATYRAVAAAAVDGSIWRALADADYRLGSVQVRIGCASAGSETIDIYGATVADFSDEVLLGSTTFTATGSYTPDEVSIAAPGTAGLTFYRATGPGDVRIHTVRLYEPASDASAVSAALSGHIADTTDAHDASAISIVDAGAYFTGTTVEAALQELAEAPGGGGLDSVSDGTTTVSSPTDITVPLGGLSDPGGGVAGLEYLVNRNGGLARVELVADAGSTYELDWGDYLSFDLTLTENCTITFANVPDVAGREATIFVTLHGNYEVSWPVECTLLNSDTESGTRQAVVTTGDGGNSFGVTYSPAAPPVIDALDLSTTETDDTLVLKPDGFGGVTWATDETGTSSYDGTQTPYTPGAAVTMTNANTEYTGVTTTPAAGTYDVLARLAVKTGSASQNVITNFRARLKYGSTVVDEAPLTSYVGNDWGYDVHLVVFARITADGSTAITLAGISDRAGGQIVRDPFNNSSGIHRATVLVLTKV